MELDDEVLLVHPEVYLFRIDPRLQKKEKYLHRASDWDVANPVWTGKLMLIAAGPNCCHVQLENRKGVFGQAVINEYPSPQMFEPVLDSRRYFTLKIQNITGDFQVVGLGVSTHKESSELSNVLKGYFATSPRPKRVTIEEPSNENSPKKMKIAEVKPEPHVKAVVTAAVKSTATVAPTPAATKAVKKEISTPKVVPPTSKVAAVPAAKTDSSKTDDTFSDKTRVKAVTGKAPPAKILSVKAVAIKATSTSTPTLKAPAGKSATAKAPVPAVKAPSTKAPSTKAPSTKPPSTKACPASAKPVPSKAISTNATTATTKNESKTKVTTPAQVTSTVKSTAPAKPSIKKPPVAPPILRPSPPKLKTPPTATVQGTQIQPPRKPVLKSILKNSAESNPTVPSIIIGSVNPAPSVDVNSGPVRSLKTPLVPYGTLSAAQKALVPYGADKDKDPLSETDSPSSLLENPLPQRQARTRTRVKKSSEPSGEDVECIDLDDGDSKDQKSSNTDSKTGGINIESGNVATLENGVATAVPDKEAPAVNEASDIGAQINSESSDVEMTDVPKELESSEVASEIKENVGMNDTDENQTETEEAVDAAENDPEVDPFGEQEEAEGVSGADPLQLDQQLSTNDASDIPDEVESAPVIESKACEEDDAAEGENQNDEEDDVEAEEPNEMDTTENELVEFGDVSEMEGDVLAVLDQDDESEEAEEVQAEENPEDEVEEVEEDLEEDDEDQETQETEIVGEDQEEEDDGTEENEEADQEEPETEESETGDTVADPASAENNEDEVEDEEQVEEEEEQNDVEDEEGQQQESQQEEADNDNENGEEEEEEEEKTATCVFNTPIKNYKYRNGNKFQCHKCPETFDDMRLIKTHWRNAHSYKGPGHCVVCKLPFPSKVEVAQHRRSAHGFQCPECSKEFKKEVGLKDHIKNQHGKKLQFECTHCPASFKIRFQLMKHIENQHEHESGQVILHQCDECHEKFITGKELAGHKLKHEEHIKCDRCSQRFPTKAGLRSHYRQSHAGFTQPRS